ncbi:TPR repeat containing exported protein; Putative periplasmic protein contains a protein prenylyltransferase domain [hydrothermal vent metagenome]|uniref:TPR repeat containing exported protein Putative periplasmic protein contains a protein prenylyltransferase domain n=1 Tax=hydrothermal vent metagenome TaxID=652676 RepID=A0A1W1C6Q9_9ZZZZ
MKIKLLTIASLFSIYSTLSYAYSDREKLAMLQQRLDQLSERVEGLTTIVEGLNNSVNNLSIANQQSLSSNLSLTALKSKIDRIDRECIKRDNDNSKQSVRIEREKDSNKNKIERSSHQNSIEGKDNSILYREGARFFQKQQYKKAEDRFKLMIERGYKKASSNYYLGEIAYYTKNYSDAIHYYKKSAKLYDKASYIDILLLHTAVSLEKIGDTAQAKQFYNTIIDDYPDRKSSKIAKKNLKKL